MTMPDQSTDGRLSPTPPSERENREIEAANRSRKTPVVFIHGLWVLPEQLGQVGGLLRASRIRAADAGLARRSGDR